MSTSFNLSNPNRTVHVGVILMNGITEILDVAPLDLFTTMSKKINDFSDIFFPPELKKQAIDVEFHWVNEYGQTAHLSAGIRLQPTVGRFNNVVNIELTTLQDSFTTCPPLDVVIMGAHLAGYEPTEKELAFIRKSYDDCSAFITICGGMQAPLQAGLFKGKTVTCPEPILEDMRQNFPDVKWEKRRWVRDGKLWTSGTLLNGLDCMRAFGEEIFGKEGTLMAHNLNLGAWPVRDVHYRDVRA